MHTIVGSHRELTRQWQAAGYGVAAGGVACVCGGGQRHLVRQRTAAPSMLAKNKRLRQHHHCYMMHMHQQVNKQVSRLPACLPPPNA